MTLNNNNVKTVLPATGSGSPANTAQDQKSYKQELKNRINTLKLLQKDTQKNLSAAQKELTKLSTQKAPKTAFKTQKKELNIVKKKNSKNK